MKLQLTDSTGKILQTWTNITSIKGGLPAIKKILGPKVIVWPAEYESSRYTHMMRRA